MKEKTKHDTIIILDFGSQYTQLIARQIREAKVYCEVLPYSTQLEEIQFRQPSGIILSGSPASVYDSDAPRLPAHLLETLTCPILGICYGLQVLAADMGGRVEPSSSREYGSAQLQICEGEGSQLFEGLPAKMDVWMSHGDHVTELPAEFRIIARSKSSLNAVESLSKRIYGLQFHPEVAHTPSGKQILQNFVLNICRANPDWSPHEIIAGQIAKIRALVGNKKVICGLSGGIDSTVAATLVHQAIGEQQTCIFVDTGLLRKDEYESTIGSYKTNLNLKVRGVPAGERFLAALEGVTDPEEKRRTIGHLFIKIFEECAGAVGDVDFLVQGTLYPDVIESVSVGGPSAVIKSHHNVGGLPEKMRLRLIEPLRELFKDEARLIGRELGVPEEILGRHPFPGPGLAVRILGEVTAENLSLLRRADRIVEEELRADHLYDEVWQAFPVLLPVSTVGVMGDQRTYERVIALRAVTSTDGMTADWARLPHELLGRISTRLVAEVKGLNRVVYDISSKPPSTIEWE